MKTYDEDLFVTDDPFDELALYAVAQGQRDSWDELTPVVTLMDRCTLSASTTDITTGVESVLVSPHWLCLRAIPWIVQPGESQIKVHLFCRGPVAEDYAPEVRISEGVVPPYGNAANTASSRVFGSLTFGWKTLTLNLKPSDTARFTFIQVWYRSDVGFAEATQNFYEDAAFPSVPRITGDRRMIEETGDWVLEHPDSVSERASALFRVRVAVAADVTSGRATTVGDKIIIDSFQILQYGGIFRIPDNPIFYNGFEVFPTLPLWNSGDEATGYSVHTLPPLYVRNIMVETVRESSAPPSRFFTAVPDQMGAGNLPKSEMMLRLASGEDRLSRLRRPLAASFSREQIGPFFVRYPTWEFTSYRANTAGDPAVIKVLVGGPVDAPILTLPGQTKIVAYLLITSSTRSRRGGGVFSSTPLTMDVSLDVLEISSAGYTDTTLGVTVEDVLIPLFRGSESHMLKYLNERREDLEMADDDVASLLDPAYVKLLRIEIPSIDPTASSAFLMQLPQILRLNFTPPANYPPNVNSKIVVLGFSAWGEL